MFKVIVTKNLMTILIMVQLCIAGCAFNNLKEEAEILTDSTILVGIVSSVHDCNDVPVIVAAYTKVDDERTIAHYTALHEPGPYELIVPEGDYYLFAFGDGNRNLVYDGDEPAGQYRRSEILSVAAGGVVGDLDIAISEEADPKVDFPVGASVSESKPDKLHFTSPGTMADLDEPIFSEAFGRKGYWAPLEFYRKLGGNIYFLEAYHPEKIPVLFVHGACGSPREWRAIVENIDNEQFQPWFFYYPSGASIESMSHLLFWKVFNLQRKYQFNTMYIAAHSMGGLVARSFLVNFAQSLPIRIKFISISTPWGGDDLAKTGVKYSPAVIPAWNEIRSDSEFIKSLYEKKMPETVEHYLFFSYRGNNNPFLPNNDTVVTLQSELDLRSQAEAKMVFGLNEDHEDILSSNHLMSQFNAILKTGHQKKGIPEPDTNNMLRVQFSYDYPPELPKPQPALLLRSIDYNQEIIINLKHDSNGSEVGPIPSGTYHASLVAHAFTPSPLKTVVTIDEVTRPEVEFVFKPQGILVGTIARTRKANNQAGLIMRPDSNVKINSISLHGNDISRTLDPTAGEFDFFDHYLSESDFTYNGFFYFFNLPEGEYRLTVDAEGYRKYSALCKIIPGQNYNLMNIVLQHDI